MLRCLCLTEAPGGPQCASGKSWWCQKHRAANSRGTFLRFRLPEDSLTNAASAFTAGRFTGALGGGGRSAKHKRLDPKPARRRWWVKKRPETAFQQCLQVTCVISADKIWVQIIPSEGTTSCVQGLADGPRRSSSEKGRSSVPAWAEQSGLRSACWGDGDGGSGWRRAK